MSNEALPLPNCIAVIGEALAILRNDLGLNGEIVVADNGSTDGSQALARDLGARVVDVAEKGYGAALRGGFAAAAGATWSWETPTVPTIFAKRSR